MLSKVTEKAERPVRNGLDGESKPAYLTIPIYRKHRGTSDFGWPKSDTSSLASPSACPMLMKPLVTLGIRTYQYWPVPRRQHDTWKCCCSC